MTRDRPGIREGSSGGRENGHDGATDHWGRHNHNRRFRKQRQRTNRGGERNSRNNTKPPERQRGICGAGSFGSRFLPRKPPTARRQPLLFTIAVALLLLYGMSFPVYYYAAVFRTQSLPLRAIDPYQHRHLPPPVRHANNNNNNNNKADHLLNIRKTVRFVPKYPRMIHLLHIHKSAGSFLCKLAKRNRMAAAYQKNCNVRKDLRCCWYGSDDEHPKGFYNLYDFEDNNDFNKYIRYNETEMVEPAIRFAAEAPYDFVASEKELAGPMLPDHFDYVVSLRNSRDRYESHWRHIKRDAETSFEVFNDKQQKRSELFKRKQKQQKNGPPKRLSLAERHELFNRKQNQRLAGLHQAADSKNGDGDEYVDEYAKERKDDPGHYNLTLWDKKNEKLFPVGNFTKWVEGQPDNFNLRMICGSACSGVPKYKITGELFAFALERLWVNFSHVILVEDMEASLGAFATTYGWTVSLEEDGHGPARAKASANAKPSARAKASANAKASATPIHGRPSPVDASWDPYMTVLDDALYELARRKLRHHQQRQQQSPPSAKTVGRGGVPLVPPARFVWREKYSREALPNQDLIEAYFREGPLRNCTNPCCGNCSKW